MSDVVEKTLTALPGLFDSQTGAAKVSSRLKQLVKSITELTSKHDEERLMEQELHVIKDQASSPNTTMKQMRELMVRAMYCEMLGYDASFAYIHAIKLAQQGDGLEKRVGYLAVSLFLSEGHELLLLLVNTVLKDLQSSSLIDVCMALTVVAQLFPKDMIPAVLPLLEDKLSHSKEIIRRKAVLALYKFHLVAPNQVQHIHGRFRKALCDRDAGVMAASLHIYLQLITENPCGYKDLTGSFITILKQVLSGKLPLDFNYHNVPAPWLQIQLLRVLSLLGRDDQSTSELMYDVLEESLRRAEMNHNITYAVLYECVRVVYTIHPRAPLLEQAARCIGNFLLSPKINLKYLGLKALTYVVQHDPRLALQHQTTIMECLDHSDLTIRRETLELLFRITNGQNVSVIVQKMLCFLRNCSDEHTIILLVGKVAALAEKFAPDNLWFIQTMTDVFFIGGDLLPQDVSRNFLRVLAEGSDSPQDDAELRMLAVNAHLKVLRADGGRVSQRFLQVISWVMGEFSHLQESVDQSEVIQLLTALLAEGCVSSETRVWLLSAITKLCEGRAELIRGPCEAVISSADALMRQQVQELRHLSQDPRLLRLVLPRGGCWDGLEVDSSLSFLDGFVSDALAAGAAPYKAPHQRQQELSEERALSLEPYGFSLPSCITDRQSPTLPSVSSGPSGNDSGALHRAGSSVLVLDKVARVWGKDGYLPQKPSTPPVEDSIAVFPSSGQQGAAESAKQQQQLVSSLFLGLAAQSSTTLMGKSETPPSRFKKNPHPHESLSSGSSHRSSDSSRSLRSGNDQHGILLDDQVTGFHITAEQPDSASTGVITEHNGNNDVMMLGSETLTPCPSLSDLTALLSADLRDLPRSEVNSLTSDPRLSVWWCRVFRDDALLLVLFVCNRTDGVMRDVAVQLSCEELMTASVRGNVLECLDADSATACHYALRMIDPQTSVSFSGAVCYQTQTGHTHSPSFCGTLSTTDFIRPLVLTTEDYGKLWLSLSQDVKQNVALQTEADDRLARTLAVLKDTLQLHLVDVIGVEGIMSCRLLGGAPCLLHCRVNGAALSVWLRSAHPSLPDCVLYHCQKVLSQVT